MTWLDMSTAPLGKLVTVTRTVKGKLHEITDFNPDFLWLASKCGKVTKSYWIPATDRSAGRWAGFSAGELPLAWQAYVVPVHPFAEASQGEASAHSADSTNPNTVQGSGCVNAGGDDVTDAGTTHSITAGGRDGSSLVSDHIFLIDDVGAGA